MFVFGEKQLGPKMHWLAAFLVFLGSWLSGFFIIATDAWMQHPVGYNMSADGKILLDSFWGLVLNPWIALAVSAQHDRGGGYGQFRDGIHRRVLSAHGQVPRARAHLSSEPA